MATRWLVLPAVASLLASACGGSSPSTATTTQRQRAARTHVAAVDDCLPIRANVRPRRFGAGSTAAQGAIVGRGAIGVVFANQSASDLCGWVPFARELARRGVASALFDWQDGYTAAPVLAAARALRSAGARRVTAVGASVGGRVVIAAAGRAHGLLSGIVSLSGERNARFPPMDLLSTARRDRLPTLYAGSREDGWTSFGQDSRQLYRAMPARHKRLMLVPGSDHGILLLDHPDVRRAVIRAVVGT